MKQFETEIVRNILEYGAGLCGVGIVNGIPDEGYNFKLKRELTEKAELNMREFIYTYIHTANRKQYYDKRCKFDLYTAFDNGLKAYAKKYNDSTWLKTYTTQCCYHFVEILMQHNTDKGIDAVLKQKLVKLSWKM